MKYDVEKISNKIKNKRMTKKLFKCIILTILISLFIINLILSFEENTHILGIYMFNIVSSSMEPNLEINDVVIVKKCPANELKEGDIITFLQDDRTISHRILKITNDEGELKFITKGDNNEIADKDEVDSDKIYGKVLFSVKRIGKIIQYIQNVRGFINIIIFAIIIFVLVSLNDNHKNNRKMKRRKYEIKKMRDSYHL